MVSQVKCKFLEDGNCSSVMANDEAKEVRKISCSNDNEQACCYLCSYYKGCEISCNFLGENKNQSKNKRSVDSVKAKKKSVLRCPLCDSKMLYTKMNLRAGGWEGFLEKGLPLRIGEFGEISEELLQ